MSSFFSFFCTRLLLCCLDSVWLWGSTAGVRCFPVSGHTDKAYFNRRPAVNRTRCFVGSRLTTLSRACATEKYLRERWLRKLPHWGWRDLLRLRGEKLEGGWLWGKTPLYFPGARYLCCLTLVQLDPRIKKPFTLSPFFPFFRNALWETGRTVHPFISATPSPFLCCLSPPHTHPHTHTHTHHANTHAHIRRPRLQLQHDHPTCRNKDTVMLLNLP